MASSASSQSRARSQRWLPGMGGASFFFMRKIRGGVKGCSWRLARAPIMRECGGGGTVFSCGHCFGCFSYRSSEDVFDQRLDLGVFDADAQASDIAVEYIFNPDPLATEMLQHESIV